MFRTRLLPRVQARYHDFSSSVPFTQKPYFLRSKVIFNQILKFSRQDSTQYKRQLTNHLKKCHPESPVLLAEISQRNKCTACGKTFNHGWSLKMHMETTHGVPSVPCPICGILFKGQLTLSYHLKNVHDESTRHHCPEPGCTVTVQNSSHLKVSS